MLGDELFVKALQEFIIRWEGKHPTPYDMFFTFNDVTGQDLTWFWKPWFFDFGYPDLAIDKVQSENNKAKILIRKIGNVPTPINLKMIYQDGNEDEYYYSTGIWKSNDLFFEIEIELKGTLNEIQLGSLTIPDSNRENNLYLVH
jgi:aminopeptidase N